MTYPESETGYLLIYLFGVLHHFQHGTGHITMGSWKVFYFIFLFGVLRRFQHCTGHITTGSWKGRGNQYIEFARVLYCKLPTNGKQLPAFPHKALTGIEPQPQRWEVRVLPLCHRGPWVVGRAEETSTYSLSGFCTVNC